MIELLYFLTKNKEKRLGVQPSTRHILFPNLASLTHTPHDPHRFVHKSTFFGERRSNQNEETRATLPVTKDDQCYYLEKTHMNQKGRD